MNIANIAELKAAGYEWIMREMLRLEREIKKLKPPKCETCGKDLQSGGILWLRHFH